MESAEFSMSRSFKNLPETFYNLALRRAVLKCLRNLFMERLQYVLSVNSADSESCASSFTTQIVKLLSHDNTLAPEIINRLFWRHIEAQLYRPGLSNRLIK